MSPSNASWIYETSCWAIRMEKHLGSWQHNICLFSGSPDFFRICPYLVREIDIALNKRKQYIKQEKDVLKPDEFYATYCSIKKTSAVLKLKRSFSTYWLQSGILRGKTIVCAEVLYLNLGHKTNMQQNFSSKCQIKFFINNGHTKILILLCLICLLIYKFFQISFSLTRVSLTHGQRNEQLCRL